MHNHVLPADGLSGLPEAVLFGWAQAGCQTCLNQRTSHLRSRAKQDSSTSFSRFVWQPPAQEVVACPKVAGNGNVLNGDWLSFSKTNGTTQRNNCAIRARTVENRLRTELPQPNSRKVDSL
jgi:hypothetical protein